MLEHRLRHLPAGALVISDTPGLVWRAGRRVPDRYVDVSILRITSPTASLRLTGDDIVRDGRIIGLDLTADWCMSPPEFRGNLLYATCTDNGFMALRLDPAVYPPR